MAPEVRQAQAQEQMAEAHARTAQLERQTRAGSGGPGDGDSWRTWRVGAENLALIVLMLVVPALLVGSLVGAWAVVRRHLSYQRRTGGFPSLGSTGSYPMKVWRAIRS